MSLITTKTYQAAPHRVAEHVRGLIRSQALQVGDMLPTYEKLCDTLGFSYVTIKRGMDLLQAQGLVRRVPSQGTFVAKELVFCGRKLSKLGLIFPGSRELLFRLNYLSEIVRGVLMESQHRDIDLHIFSLSRDGLVLADQLTEASVDGVLLLDVEDDEYLSAFAKWGTPGVVVDYQSSTAPLEYLACDNIGGVRQAVQHVAELGHQRIAYIDGVPSETVRSTRDVGKTVLVRTSSDVVERRVAAEAELARRGLLRDDTVIPLGLDSVEESLGILAAQFCGARAGVSAFLTYDEAVALSLIRHLARRGMRVPEDVSVCAVAGAGDAFHEGRPLTYCRFDFVGMGRQSLRLLAERCRAPGLTKPEVQRIGFEFIRGETTAPAPQGARGVSIGRPVRTVAFPGPSIPHKAPRRKHP
jgi:DNA-binding LacI/PurR family transcriptional regulator